MGDRSKIIKFKTIGNGTCWSGSDWSIVDENELAVLIARVALGQHLHVIKVLTDTDCIPYGPTMSALVGAIKMLTAQNPEKPYHRDGWMFQVIAWIAANIQNPDSLKMPPHIRHTDKGFDGLHLCLDDSKEDVISVIICEEKATTDPRGKINSKVWPDFRSLESGTRDGELVSEITTLLCQNRHVDPEKAVHKILWKQARAYRVSITIGENENSKDGRKALFKGYKTNIPGEEVEKRRAETLFQSNLRDWMEKMAIKAISAAKRMEFENV